jgi:endonuclease III related protein
MSHHNTHTSFKKGTRPLVVKAYNLLYKTHGPQGWWPASAPFEVAIGAILTQNTSWSNVEKAIKGLKKKKLLTPAKLQKATLKKIAAAIKPCGYYNIKAGRLKNFTHFLFKNYKGRIENMKQKNTTQLREELLSVNGIGPETCDSILLYALNKSIFVVDAYTRRMAQCLNITEKTNDYNFLQSVFTLNLPKDYRLFNEYHALIVRHAKDVCKNRPQCEKCVLRRLKRSSYVSKN